MLFKFPINDCHIHLFDPKDMDECSAMVDWCGYTNWAFLACTQIRHPLALTQNLLCALMKLREGGRCHAFGSLHYNPDGSVPEADDLLEQIKWFDAAGFDGLKMLDGKPGVRMRQGIPLDAPNYDKMFDYAQRTQFPILYHINDPIEFWYEDQLPQWAVKQGLFYDKEHFIHKYEMDEETFGILRKHPNLNLCIAHFFFISDQPGLCCEMLDRYPNLFFDITPGWEMFENFAKDWDYWRNFFGKYSHKIMFGTDTFSDHWKETVTCLQRVLETDEKFVAFEENCHGLDLPEDTLHDLYFNNYHKFIRNPDKKINVEMILAYADTLYARIPEDWDQEKRNLVTHNIEFLKGEIAKFR